MPALYDRIGQGYSNHRRADPRIAAIVRGEALPFATDSFDCAMAMLTIHHWPDQEGGIDELARVARGRVVLLTWVGFPSRFWLMDYFPEVEQFDIDLFPSVDQLAAWLGPLRVLSVPIFSEVYVQSRAACTRIEVQCRAAPIGAQKAVAAIVRVNAGNGVPPRRSSRFGKR